MFIDNASSLFQVEPGKDEKDTIVLDRHDTYGELWLQQRYQIPEEPTFSFIQWMDAREARLKEVTIIIQKPFSCESKCCGQSF